MDDELYVSGSGLFSTVEGRYFTRAFLNTFHAKNVRIVKDIKLTDTTVLFTIRIPTLKRATLIYYDFFPLSLQSAQCGVLTF